MVKKEIDDIPKELIECQNKKQNNDIEDIEKEQNENAWLGLFFSFDIVNSTKYKTLTTQWPIIIKKLLEYMQKLVMGEEIFKGSVSLWRVIGDEIIFYMKVGNISELAEAIDSIFKITQKISHDLKSGKFSRETEYNNISKNEIEIIKIQNNLSIKSAAWVAPISSQNTNPYNSIISAYDSEYAINNNNRISSNRVLEFIGVDIDAGFRIKSEALPRKLIISLETAYLLSKKYKMEFEQSKEYRKLSEKNFYERFIIMDYKKLKGVFDESLYPLIYYHNSKEIINEKGLIEEMDFDDTFDYDEPYSIQTVNNYFSRKLSMTSNNNQLLNPEMYNSKVAIDKIIKSKYLYKKLNYLESICPLEGVNKADNEKTEGAAVSKIELHCAVVCCNLDDKQILIAKRHSKHKTNPNMWDFGCSDAKSGEKLKYSIKNNITKDLTLI